jgi:hypothetical protein
VRARLVFGVFDAGMAANVGGDVHRSVQTFEIDIPEEAAALLKGGVYRHANVIGLELIPPAEETA